MTKSDLIDLLCEAQKMPKGRAELLINAIFDCMEASLRRGERIEIRGFGSFEIRNYRAYEGRNPRTGTAVNVKPKRLPFFKVGKELKERVNAAAATSAGGNGAGGPSVAARKPAADGGGAAASPAAPASNGKPVLASDGNAAAGSSSASSSASKASGPASVHRAISA
jgi:integration host factor subunit beta